MVDNSSRVYFVDNSSRVCFVDNSSRVSFVDNSSRVCFVDNFSRVSFVDNSSRVCPLTNVYDNPEGHYYKHDDLICLCLDRYRFVIVQTRNECMHFLF